MEVEITIVQVQIGGMWAIDFIENFSKKHVAPFFKDKYYGDDVRSIVIITFLTPYRGTITRPFRPRYVFHKESLSICCDEFGNPLTTIIDRRFYFEAVIQGDLYDEILKAPNHRKEQILAECVVNSLFNIDKLPKRLKDFDKEAFKADMISLFRSLGLID